MIPVFEPSITPEDIAAVTAALERGEISGNFGQSLEKFESEFAAYCGCKHGIAVTNGTTALQLAVAALGIKHPEEILMSSSTNIATGLAAYHNGAITVPVDSERETWNLDLSLIESLITPKTKAILPVHLYGHPVDMRAVMEIAKKHHLFVIEDCAEAHGAECYGQRVGSFGDISCFSFYANKIITTGEGGMLVTNNDELAKKARLLRNLAFSQPRFYHEVAAHNFRMTSYQAALGYSQFLRIESIIEARRKMAATYNTHLSDCTFLQLPIEKPWAKHVYWMYAVTVKPESGIKRDALLEYLKTEGIETRTFFCPMNQQPFLRQQPGYRDVPCPVADALWTEGFYVPSSPNLTEEQIRTIATTIKRYPSTL